MGYMTNGLSFNTLREANKKRLPVFKNRKGKKAHKKSDGSCWTPAQWLQAVVGELGEYANLRKKFERGDLTEKEFHAEAKKELADVVTYLDILAMQLKINLGEATKEKFNEVSERIGCNIYIGDDDDWHYRDFTKFQIGDIIRLESDPKRQRFTLTKKGKITKGPMGQLDACQTWECIDEKGSFWGFREDAMIRV